jgi:hypothetical protein
MDQPVRQDGDAENLGTPEATVSRFYNAIFGPTRMWPRAYSCLSPDAQQRFEAAGGLRSFADYWEDTLSALEEFVGKRHREHPYTHRTCFMPARTVRKDCSADRAAVSVDLLENHLSRERLVITQDKHLLKDGPRWLLTSGELDGALDDIISVLQAGTPNPTST